MIILGIDPSLVSTGCIILKHGKIVNSQLIKSKPAGNRPIDELNRILKIRNEIKMKNVKIAIIEGLAFAAHRTRAISQLSALNYLIRERLSKLKIPFIIVAPTTLKKFITGKGNSPKDIMMMAVYKRYGIEFTNNNLCDAFSLAMCGHILMSKNIKLTKPQQEVIELLRKQLKEN